MSRWDFTAYINKKCITQEMLEGCIYEYCGIHAKMEHINEYVIEYSGFDAQANFILWFYHSGDKDRYPFLNLWDSDILRKEFHYVQYITVGMIKELCGSGYEKNIIEFFFFIKSKLDCDMLITDLYKDICSISGSKVSWLLSRNSLLEIPNPCWSVAREEKQGNVKCIMLITSDRTEIEALYLQWNGRKTDEETEAFPFETDLHEEGIYAVYCGSVRECEEDILQQVTISDPYRYALHYSNRETMRYFIEKTNFPEDSYLENDWGNILPVEEVRKDILGFIE